MNRKLECIMLVDDNQNDNFFHERAIRKVDSGCEIIAKNSGLSALEYLKGDQEGTAKVDLIFLDINMPGMNGWEFLQQYSQLSKSLQSQVIVIMLTTSNNPKDQEKIKNWDIVSDFITKPLTPGLVTDIINTYFKS